MGKTILAEVPVVLMAYDLLEHEGVDVRPLPVEERRRRLAEVVINAESPSRFLLSPLVQVENWEGMAAARLASRDQLAEGLMLKRHGSAYGVGRRRGDWWKWKGQPAHGGRRPHRRPARQRQARQPLHDYTFSVWDAGKLVPIAKAYSGLTDGEIGKVDAFIRTHMIEKFGPVRTVKPELRLRTRLRGDEPFDPAQVRRRRPLPPDPPLAHRQAAAEADTIETVRALLPPEPGG